MRWGRASTGRTGIEVCVTNFDVCRFNLEWISIFYPPDITSQEIVRD